MPPAPSAASPGCLGKPGTNRNQAVLEEPGPAHGQHRSLEIDITHGQAPCLAEAKTGPVEDEQECPHGGGIELDRALAAGIDGAEQKLQFTPGEDMGRCRLRPTRLVLGCRQRRAGSMAAADRPAPESGQRPVPARPGPGERSLAGQEAENIGLADGVPPPTCRQN